MSKFIPHTVRKFTYEGPLQEPIEDFISEKRRLGNLYNGEAQLLKELSRLAISEGCPNGVLTKDLVQKWTVKQPTISKKTHYAHCSVVRQLGEYMVRMGYNAYICPLLPKGIYEPGTFVPYIFSDAELCRFFAALDTIPTNAHSPFQHLTFPLLFRMLYGCGLRLSEALTLRVRDIDLKHGVLSIHGTKFGKDRLVPMSGSLVEKCITFMDARHSLSDGDTLFFASPDGGVYSHSSVHRRFRAALWKAGISYGGRGRGPRIHDLRHTFSVHCLRNWMKNGVDLENALPYLSAYLGHVNTQATHTYLRLTAELFPEITAKAEAYAGYVVPRLGEPENETI